MPCLIYPQLTHWNSGVSMVPFKSIHVDTSSHDSEESQDNNSDESTFEEQNFHVDDDPCQRPEEHSDIFNSINEDMKMRAVKAIKSLKKYVSYKALSFPLHLFQKGIMNRPCQKSHEPPRPIDYHDHEIIIVSNTHSITGPPGPRSS